MTTEIHETARDAERPERRRATRAGVVISNKMDKTVVVAVERRVSHPRYSRVVKRTSKFYAHDEKNTCQVGDVVTIVETRPLSRLKRWRVRSILRRGRPVPTEAVEAAGGAQDTGRPAPKRRLPRVPATPSGPAAASETAGEE